MNSNTQRVKVAITGAAGQIGYALLFRIASGQMFGPHTEVELQLLEVEAALPALNGVAMELDDCAFPLLRNITCTSDPKVAFNGANWCLLVGSVPRKAGMERADLLGINGAIFVNQGKIINQVASQDVRVLVVGNPCNTNCLIAQRHAPDIPSTRFFAMMALDENRAKIQLAKKANVPVTAVTNMTIWGNHSASQVPDFYNAKINGVKASEVITDIEWLKQNFVSTVQQRGAAIIKARGFSSAASAANAVIDSIVRLTQNTKPNDSFSIASVSTGDYNIDAGLVFSFPTRVENGNIHIVKDLKFEPYTQEKIALTLQELRQEVEEVKKLNII